MGLMCLWLALWTCNEDYWCCGKFSEKDVCVCRMIPHKTKRGEAALARLKVYEGIPPPYDKTKRMVVPDALKWVLLCAFVLEFGSSIYYECWSGEWNLLGCWGFRRDTNTVIWANCHLRLDGTTMIPSGWVLAFWNLFTP